MTANLEGAACIGLHDLFDAVSIPAHQEARAICDTCPVIAACREHYLKVRKAAGASGAPEGTWAGVRRGTSKLTLLPARDRWAIEEQMFTDDEARLAWNAYCRGERTDRAQIGMRVHQRRGKEKARERAGRVA